MFPFGSLVSCGKECLVVDCVAGWQYLRLAAAGLAKYVAAKMFEIQTNNAHLRSEPVIGGVG